MTEGDVVRRGVRLVAVALSALAFAGLRSGEAKAPQDPLSTLPTNTWVEMHPSYVGAPDGGSLAPQAWNNKGAYDPASGRVIVYDRWVDSVRSGSIYANAALAYDPAANVVEVVKLSNWKVISPCQPEVLKWAPGCGYQTVAMDENAADPTPVDRHPLGSVALVPELNKFYLSGGLNQSMLYNGVFGDGVHDTWALNLGSKTWSVVNDLDARPIPGGWMMTYDPVNRLIVSFSGASDGSGLYIWLLDPWTNVWRKVSDTASGPWIGGCGVAYDTRRARVLLFGTGWDAASAGPQLWAYDVAANSWTRLADCPEPGYAPGFDYDARHDICLALNTTHTWIYNAASNTWTQIQTPMPRIADMGAQPVTYDAAHDVFVFEGGNSGYAPAQWILFRYGGPPAPDTAAPSVPTAVSATAASSTEITVSWSASTDNVGVEGYRIFRGGTQVGTSTAPSFTASGLSPSTAYSYRVAAFDAAGNVSAMSAEASATTLPAPSPAPAPGGGGGKSGGCGATGLEPLLLLGLARLVRRDGSDWKRRRC